MIDTLQLKSYGQDCGIDAIKITQALPFREANTRIKQQIQAGFFLDSERWHLRNIDDFCDVRTVLPGARSIVAACQCYLTDECRVSAAVGDPHGSVARYTWRNHYADLKKRLTKFAVVLKERYQAKSVVFSNSTVAEKPIAQRSGIGYYGKNSLIINEQFGSWIVLGEIITDIELEPDAQDNRTCENCRMCIDTCPTSAIVEPYVIDRRRCIQALTNWYGLLPVEIAEVWGDRLYGCTDCQDKCPANHNVKPRAPRADVGYVGPSVSLREILSISELDYRRKYGHNQMAAHWVDFRAIKRNALVALGNIRDRSTMPLLEKYSTSEDTVLAHTARWVMERL